MPNPKARQEQKRDLWVEGQWPRRAVVCPNPFSNRGGDVVVMGGAMQQEYKHSVPMGKAYAGRRINLTVRAFKNSG